jgi:hypothetical protein
MLLKLNVYDKASRSKGTVRMRLDFERNKWSLEQDPQQAWKYVGFSGNGTFDVKTDNHVIWIWDYDNFGGRRNTIIFWDPPESEGDSKTGGRARLFDPQDKAYKDCVLTWSVEPSAAAPKKATGGELTPIRKRVLEIIAGIPFDYFPNVKHKFPNGPPSDALKAKTAPTPDVKQTKVTNCGEFPGWIVARLGGSVPKDLSLKFKDKWGWYCLTCPMTGWDVWAQKVEAQRKGQAKIWIPRKKGLLPKPGDFYILSPGSSKNGFSHIGVFVEAAGSTWKTADTGQPSPSPGPDTPDGYTGCYEKRTFKEDDDSLELKLPGATLSPDVGIKYLKGWIDLDGLFAGWQP